MKPLKESLVNKDNIKKVRTTKVYFVLPFTDVEDTIQMNKVLDSFKMSRMNYSAYIINEKLYKKIFYDEETFKNNIIFASSLSNNIDKIKTDVIYATKDDYDEYEIIDHLKKIKHFKIISCEYVPY